MIKNDTGLSFRSLTAKPTLLMAAAFLAGVLPFLPALGYGFVYDDVIIFNNSLIKSLANWRELLTQEVYLVKASGFYRPLAMLSLAVDHALFGENPAGYHLTNIILHGLNCSLITYLAYLFFRNPYGALAAAALFAFHPAHPEAVAYISSRSDLFLALFALLALIMLVKNYKMERGISWLWAPLFFVMALLSKETAVVLLVPLAILLYQQCQKETPGWRPVILRFIPFLAALSLYLLGRYALLGGLVKRSLAPNIYISPWFLFELFLRYVSFLIFPPQRVSYFFVVPRPYPYPYPADIKLWLLAGLTALIIGAIIYIIYRYRETAVFFALLLLPCLLALYVSGSIDIIMFERYLYLPTAGLALLGGWFFLKLYEGRKKWACLGLGLLIAAYLGGTFWRMPLWKNSVVFAESLKREYPQSPYVRVLLGNAYMEQNRLAEAFQEISQAVIIDPQDHRYLNSLGLISLKLGKIPLAREAFGKALILAPDYAPALEGMGISYMLAGDYETALRYFDRALSIDPQRGSVRQNRRDVLLKLSAAPPKK